MNPLSSLRSEVEQTLWKGLLDCWLPAAVDRERGGFHQQLDRAWRIRPDHERFVVYQARLTWCACQAVLLGREDHGEWARHGIDSLWSRFWDEDHGGFWWRVDLDHGPLGLNASQKALYGLAFALYATAAAARALREPEGMDRLIRAFTWLDGALHDGQEGGWHEACGLDGRPVLEAPEGLEKDLFGLGYGTKAQNSQLHMLEALTEVYRAWPDGRVRERLEEMIEVISRRLLSPEGHLHLFVSRDWRPLSSHASHGHDIEAAFLLRDALDALGSRDEKVEEAARRLARHALAHAWDEESGGLIDSLRPGMPLVKIWWVQAESLGALAYLAAEDHPESAFFEPYLLRQWAFIRDFMLDRDCGGLYCYVSPDGREVRTDYKGDPWSGLYHEARAMMTASGRIQA